MMPTATMPNDCQLKLRLIHAYKYDKLSCWQWANGFQIQLIIGLQRNLPTSLNLEP